MVKSALLLFLTLIVSVFARDVAQVMSDFATLAENITTLDEYMNKNPISFASLMEMNNTVQEIQKRINAMTLDAKVQAQAASPLPSVSDENEVLARMNPTVEALSKLMDDFGSKSTEFGGYYEFVKCEVYRNLKSFRDRYLDPESTVVALFVTNTGKEQAKRAWDSAVPHITECLSKYKDGC
ncbi:hypothetical protein VNI00_012218 [Paramarasmius palmivorus]|uniref:Uncharacterized protein n=1 Tax=Paramarasmius palmivorus TaxID=297713 RepID=A0AAW0C6G5_9AGAR